MSDQIMVSVLCTAYNHEKYIRKTLEGFVSQKVDFKFEVIVNDDCSTDSTAEILKEYATDYSEIIVPVYQEKNMYSTGISPLLAAIVPKIRGKYIAICEGDDYWITSDKLQKQYDYMQLHPECSLCVCNGINVNESGKYIDDYIVSPISGNVSFEELFMKGGAFCPTASIFSRAEYLSCIPEYLKFYTIDAAWQAYLGSKGDVYCFSDRMTAYRHQSSGSWSEKMRNNPNAYVSHLRKMIKWRSMFDEETGFAYHDMVVDYNRSLEFDIALITVDSDYFKDKKLSMFKLSDRKDKLKYMLVKYFPHIYSKLRNKK